MLHCTSILLLCYLCVGLLRDLFLGVSLLKFKCYNVPSSSASTLKMEETCLPFPRDLHGITPRRQHSSPLLPWKPQILHTNYNFVVLMGVKTGLSLREWGFLRTGLRRIFWLKRDEVMEGWRKLYNQELCDLYSSPSIIRMIQSRRMKWVGNEVRIGRRGAHTLGRSGRRWVENIKMDLGDRIRWCGLDWPGSWQGQVESSWECGNCPLVSIRCWETVEWLHNWWPPE
jgi:hypothetical protein